MNNPEKEPTNLPASEIAVAELSPEQVETKMEQPPKNAVEIQAEIKEREEILSNIEQEANQTEQREIESQQIDKTFWEKLTDHKHLEEKIHHHSPKVLAALHLGLEMATHNPQVAHALMEHLEIIEQKYGHIIIGNVSRGVAGGAEKIGQAWAKWRSVKKNNLASQAEAAAL